MDTVARSSFGGAFVVSVAVVVVAAKAAGSPTAPALERREKRASRSEAGDGKGKGTRGGDKRVWVGAVLVGLGWWLRRAWEVDRRRRRQQTRTYHCIMLMPRSVL